MCPGLVVIFVFSALCPGRCCVQHGGKGCSRHRVRAQHGRGTAPRREGDGVTENGKVS